MRITLREIVLLGAVLLPLTGCQQEQETRSVAAPQKEATAWWKQDNAAAAPTESAMAGAAKAGWSSLAAVSPERVGDGKKLFTGKGCASCHSVGKGVVVGPDLLGITHRVEPSWLNSWLKDPTPVLESDPYAKEMLTKYLVKMPNLNLTPAEIEALSDYLRDADAHGEKQG